MADDKLIHNETIVNDAQTPVQPVNDIITALEQDFATTVRKVYVNSLNREIGFREVTANEQKTLSRVMLDNENRKDVIYDAQCAIINKTCLEQDFDIYKLTEFDRLKLLMALYQANMFKNDVKFKCKECGCENVYKLDFNNVLHKLDEITVEDDNIFTYDSPSWKYDFKIAYPTVKKVSEFHKSYNKKYKGASKQEIKTLDNLSNAEYINLFIKEVVLFNKTNNKERKILLSQYSAEDIEKLISVFPQDVFYTDNGVLKHIAENFVKKVNDTFDVHHCAQCGAVADSSSQVGGAASFL